MADGGDQTKRRGRPPASEEKRRRGQLTFRIRSDLRAAYEGRAEQNGCSISEEIEKTLERDALLMGLVLQKDDIISQLKDSIAYQKRIINNYNDFCESLRNSNKKTMLMIEAFLDASYSKIDNNGKVELEFGTKDEFKSLLSKIRLFLDQDPDLVAPRRNADIFEDGAHRSLPPTATARLRAQFGDLAGLSNDRDAISNYFEQLQREHGSEDDFSIAAFCTLIGRLGEDVLQLVPKFAPRWPRQFADLPVETRSALIGHLQHDAASVYQTLMSPKSPRGEALIAFRRIRNALLPREVADEDAEEGVVEGLGDVPDENLAGAGKRSNLGRR